MKLVLSIAFILTFSFASFAQSQELRDKAAGFYQKNEFDSATPVFESVLKVDQTDWKSWLYLGMIFAKTGQEQKSIESFNQAAFFYPKKVSSTDNNGFKITEKPIANYSGIARDKNITGKVYLAVEFKSDKTIGTIVPLKRQPYGLTQSAVYAARGIKFKPAYQGGQPITTIRIVDYEFYMSL